MSRLSPRHNSIRPGRASDITRGPRTRSARLTKTNNPIVAGAAGQLFRSARLFSLSGSIVQIFPLVRVWREVSWLVERVLHHALDHVLVRTKRMVVLPLRQFWDGFLSIPLRHRKAHADVAVGRNAAILPRFGPITLSLLASRQSSAMRALRDRLKKNPRPVNPLRAAGSRIVPAFADFNPCFPNSSIAPRASAFRNRNISVLADAYSFPLSRADASGGHRKGKQRDWILSFRPGHVEHGASRM